MTYFINRNNATRGLVFLVLVSLFYFGCKGPETESKQNLVEKQILSPLPDSLMVYLDTTIRALATAHKVRMLIKVEKDGKMASFAGYDGRNDRSVSDFSLPFEIGSITKMFTASAILQLIEEGKFSLDTPFTSLLPGSISYDGLAFVNGKDYIDSIKVYNLLNHTSGMPDYFIEGSNADEIAANGDASKQFSLEDLMTLSKKSTKARFIPGSQFEYSNINYIFLGKIIEETSGQSYQEYVQEHILDPLGMENTFFGTKNAPAKIAQGHFKGDNSEMPYSMAGPAGEIISTLDDMIIFIDGWYKGELFTEDGTMSILKNEYFNDMGMGGIKYGLGCIDLSKLSMGHAGETFGIESFTAALPNDYRFVMYSDDSDLLSLWVPAITVSAKLSVQK